MVRVRFAPSPTGFLHVGGARTALFNYLFTKNKGGKFILRIEDTDIERSTVESEQSLLRTMKWLGLGWDEGPDCGGGKGPYRQSERLEIYKEYAYGLVETGHAYEAYVYPEELEALREKMLEKKTAPHYNYEMISYYDTPDRRREFLEKGLSPVIYFKMPQKEFILNDLIKGAVTFKEGTIGDFVILRSNGMPIYNFAVVVDDALMEITHVIRGDDHLSNTLRQLAIYEAAKFNIPEFGHVSMILGPDGSRLSKRHGATAVENFQEMGYLPQSIINFLALLGWSHSEGKEIMELTEMIERFSLDKVSSNPAIFDAEKLRWMNGVYIRNLSNEDLTDLSIPYIIEAGYIDYSTAEANIKWLREAIGSIKNELHQLDEIQERISVFFVSPDLDGEIVVRIKEEKIGSAFIELFRRLQEIDSWTVDGIIELFKSTLKETKVKGKAFYTLFRIILTGREHGPELVYLVHLLGRNKMLERLEKLVAVL